MVESNEMEIGASNLPLLDSLKVTLLIFLLAGLSILPTNSGPKSKDYSF